MKERLSALMDDQGDHAECEHCLGEVRVDAELRETWQVYHLIGDVLRGTDGGTLPATFAQRLADEPTILAPRSARGSRGTLRRYVLPIAASVAAVAFVAWIALPQLQNGTELQADAGATERVAALPVAATPVVATPVAATPAVATPVPLARDVGDYLLAHQRYSPSSAMSGVAPYVRTVSESTPAR